MFGETVKTDYGPLPAHYGRRCFGLIQTGPKGEYERCRYRWTGKECPDCEEINDISARYCYVCKGELVNPNDKLVADFKELKKDPTRVQTDIVLSLKVTDGISQRGNRTLRADWVTPHRKFSTWFQPDSTSSRGMGDYLTFKSATKGGTVPETVTYRKDPGSGFFRILGYNKPADEEPMGKAA